MSNMLRGLVNAVTSKQTNQPEPTTFAVLGELTKNKLTRIRGVAEKKYFDKSSLPGYTLEKFNDIKSGQVDGYTFFKADNETEFNDLKEKSTYNKVKNVLLNAILTRNTNVNTPKPVQQPLPKNPLKKSGGSRTSKRTQRRRQKSQNRKSRHI